MRPDLIDRQFIPEEYIVGNTPQTAPTMSMERLAPRPLNGNFATKTEWDYPVRYRWRVPPELLMGDRPQQYILRATLPTWALPDATVAPPFLMSPKSVEYKLHRKDGTEYPVRGYSSYSRTRGAYELFMCLVTIPADDNVRFGVVCTLTVFWQLTTSGVQTQGLFAPDKLQRFWEKFSVYMDFFMTLVWTSRPASYVPPLPGEPGYDSTTQGALTLFTPEERDEFLGTRRRAKRAAMLESIVRDAKLSEAESAAVEGSSLV
uniref:ORF2 n=1 Tax=Lone star tick nodavirus TaxID=2027377 RepID=A0A223PQX7_9VIRU|nr:ORF2 [Lone star tick nodavirus]